MPDLDKELERAVTALMGEYEALKAEQLKRIATRDNIIYLTIGAIGVVVSVSIKDPFQPFALLVPPWICLLLGWLHIINDQKVVDIGTYFKLEMVPMAKRLVGKNVKALGWETFRSEQPRRKGMRLYQFAVKVLAFFVPGAASLSIFLVNYAEWKGKGLALSIVALLEAVLMVGLLFWLDRYISFRNWDGANERRNQPPDVESET